MINTFLAKAGRIVNSYTEIEIIKAQELQEGIITICILITIEGLHVLNTGFTEEPDKKEVLRNLKAIKNWQHPPFFITMAHHFWKHIPALAMLLASSHQFNKGFISEY